MRPGSPTPAGGRPPLQQILAGILSDLAILIRAEITLIQARLVSAAVRSAVAARVAIGLPVPAAGVDWGRYWELHTRPVPDDLPSVFD